MPTVAFHYRDFWDVPRLILCKVAGVDIMLDSEFDDAREEYSRDYKVYLMPPELNPEQTSLSPGAPSAGPEFMGMIPVSGIEFDASKRKELEAAPILKLIRQYRNKSRGGHGPGTDQ